MAGANKAITGQRLMAPDCYAYARTGVSVLASCTINQGVRLNVTTHHNMIHMSHSKRVSGTRLLESGACPTAPLSRHPGRVGSCECAWRDSVAAGNGADSLRGAVLASRAETVSGECESQCDARGSAWGTVRSSDVGARSTEDCDACGSVCDCARGTEDCDACGGACDCARGAADPGQQKRWSCRVKCARRMKMLYQLALAAVRKIRLASPANQQNAWMMLELMRAVDATLPTLIRRECLSC